jgi:anti-sigma regulatory factor (Ser/Thr protein kinase)
MQYRNRALRFELKVADEAQFAFIDAQRMELRRSLSNLINNAVDASTKKAEGVITLRLMADTKSVDLMIIDQGQGMPDDALEKIRNKHSFTEGKKDGHGIGLQQVWDMLDHNQGSMAVESILHKGTCFHLSFPSIPAPDWMMQTIHLPMNSIIVILDDDDSIHTAWDLRFGSVLASHTTLEVHHFMQGNDAIHFLSNLSPQNKERVVLFSDYELLRQERNGLQVIEASQPKHATLVTSYYASFDVRDAAMKLGVKILPKQMAPVVPIYVA